jgi:hypothetical protein
MPAGTTKQEHTTLLQHASTNTKRPEPICHTCMYARALTQRPLPLHQQSSTIHPSQAFALLRSSLQQLQLSPQLLEPAVLHVMQACAARCDHKGVLAAGLSFFCPDGDIAAHLMQMMPRSTHQESSAASPWLQQVMAGRPVEDTDGTVASSSSAAAAAAAGWELPRGTQDQQASQQQEEAMFAVPSEASVAAMVEAAGAARQGEVLSLLWQLFAPAVLSPSAAPSRALVYSVARSAIACDLASWQQDEARSLQEQQEQQQGAARLPLTAHLLSASSSLAQCLHLMQEASSSEQLPHALLDHTDGAALLQHATSAADAVALLGSRLYRSTPLAGDDSLASAAAGSSRGRGGSWQVAALTGLPEGVAAAAVQVLLKHGCVEDAVRAVYGAQALNGSRAGGLHVHWQALLTGLLGQAGPSGDTLEELMQARRQHQQQHHHHQQQQQQTLRAAMPDSVPQKGPHALLTARRSTLPAALSALSVAVHSGRGAADKAVAIPLLAALASHGPPLGVRGHPQQLLHHWRTWCGGSGALGAAGWVALLRGLWLAGDNGTLIVPWLRTALQHPMGLPGHGRKAQLPHSSAQMAAGTGPGPGSTGAGQLAKGSVTVRQYSPAQERDHILGQLLRSVVLERSKGSAHQRLQLLRSCMEAAAELGLPLAGDYALSQAMLAVLLQGGVQQAHDSRELPEVTLRGLAMGSVPRGRTARVLASVCGVLEGSQPMSMVKGIGVALPSGQAVSMPQAVALAKESIQQVEEEARLLSSSASGRSMLAVEAQGSAAGASGSGSSDLAALKHAAVALRRLIVRECGSALEASVRSGRLAAAADGM